MTLKVGIIGGGFGLKVQEPIIQSHPNMEVTAVSTVKRHVLPDELKGNPAHYQDWKKMIDQEQLDLVFVSSMPLNHFEMAKYALENGVDVVCEKPFTKNSEESQALLELAEKTGQKLLLDFEWRYLPGRQKVKRMLEERKVGGLLHFDYQMSMGIYKRLGSMKRGWLGKKDQAGGMLGALGSHLVDNMRWLTESEVDRINGLLMTHVPEADGESRDADDGFVLQGVLENGTTFSIQFLSGVNHSFGSSLKLFGTEGTIKLDNDESLKYGAPDEDFVQVDFETIDVPEGVPERYYPAFYPYLEKVYDYIAHDQLDGDLPTVHDGHENQKVLDEVYRQN
ncbi:Gfo/Idh/MocA family protein [Aquisalibacillus elongatus]|uniref:Putative dehydrogenase n=1 Tax=Aquisalibacillus elongatus TaxID=485577 RepID=A0A3N5C350_9BACI|nr:Gfo/Idh/MocA family oxidoreductase [Aquisalibacillus elongatus]RPF50651.1 putative dehydrogenase [Aquisalibacillus elongatus]